MEKFHREAFATSEGDVDYHDDWATSAGELGLSKSEPGESVMKRLVMVRKTEQKTYLTTKQGNEPALETVTLETIETYSGGRRITTQQRKHLQPKPEDNDMFEAALKMQKLALGTPIEPVALPKEVTSEEETKKEPVKQKKKEEDEEDLSGFSQYEIECLRRHNELRAKHGSPPMKLDKELSKFAQGWAERCASMNAMQHSTTHSENIAMSYDATVTGDFPVNMWYDEIKMHNYSWNNFVYQTGHFTQVVWKKSVRLGAGKAQAANGHWYLVAAYEPRGNMGGCFIENVRPPLQ